MNLFSVIKAPMRWSFLLLHQVEVFKWTSLTRAWSSLNTRITMINLKNPAWSLPQHGDLDLASKMEPSFTSPLVLPGSLKTLLSWVKEVSNSNRLWIHSTIDCFRPGWTVHKYCNPEHFGPGKKQRNQAKKQTNHSRRCHPRSLGIGETPVSKAESQHDRSAHCRKLYPRFRGEIGVESLLSLGVTISRQQPRLWTGREENSTWGWWVNKDLNN